MTLQTTSEIYFALVRAIEKTGLVSRWTEDGALPWNARAASVGARDGWWCFYCDTPLAAVDGSGEGWIRVATVAGFPDQSAWAVADGYRLPQVDHIVPRGRGGSNDLPNLALSCGRCNSSKGMQMPLEVL
jgi:hypothetical protein